MTPVQTILVINGPNLNLFGTREPDIYGTTSYEQIGRDCEAKAESLGVRLDFRQSNHEGVLIDWIQEAGRVDGADAIVINAAAYTHTSIAIADALKAVRKPVVEVHMSNIYKRESFRHRSYVSPVATGIICGLGPLGYVLAVEAAARLLGRGLHEKG